MEYEDDFLHELSDTQGEHVSPEKQCALARSRVNARFRLVLAQEHDDDIREFAAFTEMHSLESALFQARGPDATADALATNLRMTSAWSEEDVAGHYREFKELQEMQSAHQRAARLFVSIGWTPFN